MQIIYQCLSFPIAASNVFVCIARSSKISSRWFSSSASSSSSWCRAGASSPTLCLIQTTLHSSWMPTWLAMEQTAWNLRPDRVTLPSATWMATRRRIARGWSDERSCATLTSASWPLSDVYPTQWRRKFRTKRLVLQHDYSRVIGPSDEYFEGIGLFCWLWHEDDDMRGLSDVLPLSLIRLLSFCTVLALQPNCPCLYRGGRTRLLTFGLDLGISRWFSCKRHSRLSFRYHQSTMARLPH